MITSKADPEKHLILGVDPGTTTGVAILDLNSRLLLSKSARVLSKSDIISLASSRGKVVLVATDRVQPPKLVADVARALGAKLFSPDLEFSCKDKLKVVSDFLALTKDVPADEHQTAALFGAIKAFKAYKNQFEEAVKAVEALELPDKEIFVEQVKAYIVSGMPTDRALKLALAARSKQGPVAKDAKTLPPRRPKTSLKSVAQRSSKAAGREPHPRVRRHAVTIVIPSSEAQPTSGKLAEEPEGYEPKPAEESEPLPNGHVAVKMVGAYTRRRIRDMAKRGFLSRGDIVYGTGFGEDLERVGRALREAGVSVAIFEELDDSSILQMMNEGVVPIPASSILLEPRGSRMTVEENKVKEAVKRMESRYRELLLKLLSETR